MGRLFASLARTCIVMLGIFFLLALVAMEPVPFKMVGTLLFGWISFLLRVVPQITPNPQILATSGLCLALIVLGVHSFAKWFFQSRPPQSDSGGFTGSPWRFSWSLSLVAAPALLFLIGMAVIGIVHQAAWMVADDTPLVVSSRERFLHLHEVRHISSALEQSLLEHPRDPGVRASEFAAYFRGGREEAERLLGKYHVLLFQSASVTNEGWIIFNRDPARRKQDGIEYHANGDSASLSAEKLDELLSLHRDEIVPFPGYRSSTSSP